VVLQIEKILTEMASDSALLEKLRQQGMHYAREYLSWDGKAQLVTEILRWAVLGGPKPDLPPRCCAIERLGRPNKMAS
jgi:hypothetical protein